MSEALKLQHKAYELAVQKGGYNPDHEKYPYFQMFVLDPLFWQALGKVLGWDYSHVKNASKHVVLPTDEGGTVTYFDDSPEYHALRYHYLALTGGNTEKFWKDLIGQ